ncbi:MAG TPA: hypothetical protein DEP84_05505 [Chloroflexi bacterium]|nr:hypothetical protein [Chloroflexota bacterium]
MHVKGAVLVPMAHVHTETRDVLEIAERAGVPAEAVIRIAHRVDDAIIHTAFERRADLLVMGWRGRNETPNTSVGRNVDSIVDRVNCEVLVIQQTGVPPFQRILMPIADPLQTKAAIETARLLATDDSATITVIHVSPPGTPETRRQKLLGALELQLEGVPIEYPGLQGAVTLQEIEAPDVVEAIVAVGADHDCVILGVTRDSWLKQRFFGSKPGQIAERVEPPVILVRPKTGPVKFGLYRALNYLRGGYRRIDPTAEKELQAQGILLPRPVAGAGEPRSSINRGVLLLAGILAIVSAAAMYLGDGGAWTLVGAALFFVALLWFTQLSMAEVARQQPG